MTIEEYYADFRQELIAEAGTREDFTRSTFVEHMCDLLSEQGVVSAYSQSDYKYSSKGFAVDAWAVEEEFSTLYLFLADHREAETFESLTNSEIKSSFSRMSRFYEACKSGGFVEDLDESMPVTELAWLIKTNPKKVKKLVLVLFSNAQVSSRVASLPREDVGGLSTSYDIWDLGRLHRLALSGKEREEIEVDFTSVEKEGIRCLPAFAEEGGVKSFLLVIPGELLASFYEKYGERLFEQNVRTFLQFRGKVNKGIKITIENEPQMFFPYNNGLSATAEDVVTNGKEDRILSIKNLQIVNGGQTTASIYTAAKTTGADLSRVYVQMKLSVVSADEIQDVVPRISEYANTQNKVSAADFFSNHQVHVRIEEFSRRLWAPSCDGSVQETRWFYERARGQYGNQQTTLTPAQKRKFLSQHPRNQMFTKTDLAKYILSFDEQPHVVSLGAQKAFAGSPKMAGFVSQITKEWDKTEGKTFNEVWFKRAVAKTIIFRTLDRLIRQQDWYNGYKANIVTYTLAKFSQVVREKGLAINFLAIWNSQLVPQELSEELVAIGKEVADLIMHPPSGTTSNIGEWAKQPACWSLVSDHKYRLSEDVMPHLTDPTKVKEIDRDAGRTQVIQDQIHDITYVVEKGAEYWSKLSEWNSINRKLSPKETQFVGIASQIPRKIPNEKQVSILLRAEARAKTEGFRE